MADDQANKVWVAYADPASGRVLGVYSDKDKAEASAFRFSKTSDCYDGLDLRVLEFNVDTDGEIKES